MKTPLLYGLALAVAAAALTSCAPPKSATMPMPKVTVAQPITGTVTNWDEYPGHVEAVETVEIRPRVSGYIDAISFQDGAEVKAGDLLFVIDPRPFRAALDQAKAETLRAETRVELAQNDLKRAEGLRGTKAISDEEYDTRSKAAREAEAALTAAKAAQAVVQLNLDYPRVTAPINGRIGRRLVTAGTLVQGGGMMPGTLLATLVSVDPVYFYFDVDEAAFRRYRANIESAQNAGQKEFALACDIALGRETGYTHRGRIDFFDNEVSARTGTIRVRGVFANADRALVPGMFATVRVAASLPMEAMLVPAVAVATDQGDKFVLIVNQDSVVAKRPVKLGRQHGAMQAVLEGLTTQDQVIVNGLVMARAGGKVEVVAPTAKPVATAQAVQRKGDVSRFTHRLLSL